MRHTPLLVILLCITLSARVCAEDGGVVEASTIPMSAAVEAVSQESTFEGSAAASGMPAGGTNAAGSFDYSYFLVLTLGIAGLFWVRRQSQSL